MWRNVTDSAKGAPPSPRAGGLFAAIDSSVYILGGWDDVALHFFNDLFVLDPLLLLWSEVHANGDVPPPMSGHGVASLGRSLYLFGGIVKTASGMGTLPPPRTLHRRQHFRFPSRAATPGGPC